MKIKQENEYVVAAANGIRRGLMAGSVFAWLLFFLLALGFGMMLAAVIMFFAMGALVIEVFK